MRASHWSTTGLSEMGTERWGAPNAGYGPHIETPAPAGSYAPTLLACLLVCPAYNAYWCISDGLALGARAEKIAGLAVTEYIIL